MYIVTVISCLILSINSANPLNVLAIYPYHGKSHFFVYRVYLRELANKGHNVTVISHFPEKDPVKNYHDISLAGTLNTIEDGTIPIQSKYYGAIIDGLYLLDTAKDNCKALIANEHVQNLIKEEAKFDVVVLEQFNSDCALGVAYKLKAPVVATTSNVMMPSLMERFGIPYNPSYVYYHFFGGGTHPSFLQRLERSVFKFYFKMIHFLASHHNQNTLARYFDDIPPLEELGREIKFLLVYHYFMFTGSMLLPANVIEVGGYHVAKANRLTGDLKKFVEGAEYGVIYVSFGSLVRSSSLPSEKIDAIVGAMNELPQKFIWKWENKTLRADKNKVYFDKWLPQVDILGHPKTLAFLSHGGMGGTTEAMYSGVSMVVMPIDGDQPCNAALIEESGLGLQLCFEDLTKDNLVAAFKKVLDPKFQEKVKEVSSAWHDRPMSALDTAVFWTEYAARHPSISLRTRAADVPIYQYYCLDIITVYVGLLIACIKFVLICIKRFKKEKSVKLHQNTRNKNQNK